MDIAVEGHPRRWWALAVLCLTLTMVVIDNTVTNVAVPAIAVDLGADEAALQWITTSYALVLAGLLLPLAVFGDRHGRRTMLMVGLAVFGAASALASTADSVTALALSRGLQGVGGACAMPATLSLLGNLFPAHERGRAIAIWSATGGAAGAAGPVVGGVLVERFWWGAVFLVNVPVVVVALVATAASMPDPRDPDVPGIDPPGALAWWMALTALLVAIIELPERGAASPVVVTAVIGSAVAFRAFARRERRSTRPLVPAETVSDPHLAAGALTVSALFFTMFGGQFVVTQWLQGPRGLGPVAAGLCFVPSALASVIAPLRNPALVARLGHRSVAATGLVIAAAGAAGVGAALAGSWLPGVIAGLVALGWGMGTASPSGVELIMSSASPARAGSAAGVNETLVEASGALGVAVLGSVLAAGAGWAAPLPVAAAVAALAAFVVFQPLTKRSVHL